LAQKVADLEHSRNLKRRASFASAAESARSAAGTPGKEHEPNEASMSQDLKNLFYQGGGSPEQAANASPAKPPKGQLQRLHTVPARAADPIAESQEGSLHPFQVSP